MRIRNVKAKLGRLTKRKAPPIKLPFPIAPTLRVAQLARGPQFENVQPLVVKRWPEFEFFAPNVVIGSAPQLQRLAEQATAGGLDASCIDRALVAITHYGGIPLSDMLRVTLWQAFGVPIFELYLGLDHALLAAECEAHEGWHLARGVGFALLDDRELILDGAGNSGLRTGLSAALDPKPCPCGRSTARLLEIERIRPTARQLAASA